MIISNHKLRKLIAEAIDNAQYDFDDKEESVESKYFGIDASQIQHFVDFFFKATNFAITAQSGGELYTSIASNASEKMKLDIQFVGAGAHRVTFSIQNEFVVKIALAGKNKMNRDDFMFGTSSDTSYVFPKAFLHAEDFRWILLEKVQLCKNWGDMRKRIRSSIMKEYNDEMKSSFFGYLFCDLIMIIMGKLKSVLLFDDKTRIADIQKGKYEYEQLIKPTHANATVEDLRNDFMNDRTFATLEMLVRRYGVQPGEYRYDNMGIASDNRLVLLDSSIFSR